MSEWLSEGEREAISNANGCVHGGDCDGCVPLHHAVEKIVDRHRAEAHKNGCDSRVDSLDWRIPTTQRVDGVIRA